MISINELSLYYKRELKIIDALNITLEENAIHGIVGLNGAGKTTLLNAIYGLKNIDSGEIKFKERDISKLDISYLVSENFFYSNITGREYLELFKSSNFKIDEWNKLFSLPLDQIIDNYSTGMKKKLALMGILKQDKAIMVLDEPFNGLDLETSRIIRSILLELKKQNKTIIITSHILETLTNLCDQIHYLEAGKIKISHAKEAFEKFENSLYQSIEQKNTDLIKELTDDIKS